MTATHELWDKATMYLRLGKPNHAVEMLEKMGVEHNEARRQVGAVAQVHREHRQATEERVRAYLERRRNRPNGV